MRYAVRVARNRAVFLSVLVAVGSAVLVKSFSTTDGHASLISVRVTVPRPVLVAMHAIVLMAMFALVLVAMFASVVVIVTQRIRPQ